MQHQTITSIVFLETSESFDAAEVTKLDQRTSTVTLQKENNIKDAIAASSGELELGFHPEIHQQSQEIPRQRLRGETTQKKCRRCRYQHKIGSPRVPAGQHHRPTMKRW